MTPHWALWPMVVLAAIATVIASQAVISGSFSVAKQAVQLGFLPRLRVLHTSTVEGQIYVPIINWLLCVGVLTLTLVFRSSNKLGDIYGVAVTGTFILNTLLFLAVARQLWGRPKRKLAPIAVLFLTVEVAFFSANIAKVEHGAWLPLVVGLIMSIVMINWRRGQTIVTRNRVAQEGPLHEFLDGLDSAQPPLVRTPGVAVFLCRDKDTTPLALRADVEHTHTLPEKVVIVTADTVSIPHVETFDRCAVEVLGHGRFKVVHLTARFGYHDTLNIPEVLAQARKQGMLERNLDLEHASYFVSRITITQTDDPEMPTLAKEPVHRDGPQRIERDRSLRAPGRPDGDHGLAGRSLNDSSVASARKAAAVGDRREARWTSPTVRVIFGRALRTVGASPLRLARERRREQRGPRAGEHERDDRLPRGGFHGDLGRDPDRGERLLEQDAGRGAGRADDERRSRQLASAERPVAVGDRLGREHEQQLLLAERVGDELPAGQRKVGGAELARAVADERAYAVGALGLVDADLDPGVPLSESADQVGHRVDRERGQRGEFEPSRSSARRSL